MTTITRLKAYLAQKFGFAEPMPPIRRDEVDNCPMKNVDSILEDVGAGLTEQEEMDTVRGLLQGTLRVDKEASFYDFVAICPDCLNAFLIDDKDQDVVCGECKLEFNVKDVSRQAVKRPQPGDSIISSCFTLGTSVNEAGGSGMGGVGVPHGSTGLPIAQASVNNRYNTYVHAQGQSVQPGDTTWPSRTSPLWYGRLHGLGDVS